MQTTQPSCHGCQRYRRSVPCLRVDQDVIWRGCWVSEGCSDDENDWPGQQQGHICSRYFQKGLTWLQPERWGLQCKAGGFNASLDHDYCSFRTGGLLVYQTSHRTHRVGGVGIGPVVRSACLAALSRVLRSIPRGWRKHVASRSAIRRHRCGWRRSSGSRHFSPKGRFQVSNSNPGTQATLDHPPEF